MFDFKRIFALAAVLTFTILGAQAQAALVKYGYQGSPFTNFYLDPTKGELEEASLQISFIVDESLLPKNSLATLSGPGASSILVDFYFGITGYYGIDSAYYNADGGVGAHNDPILIDRSFELTFQTDAEGHFNGDSWSAAINHSAYGRGGFNSGVSISSSSSVDKAELLGAGGFAYFIGEINNNPGTWTRSLIPVPLPGAVWLFGSAFAFLFARLRKPLP